MILVIVVSQPPTVFKRGEYVYNRPAIISQT